MRQRSLIFMVVAFAILAGCKAGNSGTVPPNPPIVVGHGIVVADVAHNSVLTFPLTASGTTAPVTSVTGAGTNLDQPEGVFANRINNTLWVGNYTSGTGGSLTEYQLSSNGDTTPKDTISGASTTLKGPAGVYVRVDGTIFVADYNNAAIDVFSPGASGDVAPAHQISGAASTLDVPTGIWLDSSYHIWVGDTGTHTVDEFAANASGDVAPINTLTLPADAYPIGVYIDSQQNIWVADAFNGAIYEYAAGSTSASTPENTISGAATGLDEPNGVFVGPSGNIYVANYTSANVEVFSSAATGNAAPIQTIPAGVTTTLGDPIGVVVY